MSRALLSCTLAVAALLCAGEARACRVYQSPETRVRYPHDAVILARIESADYQDFIGDTGRAWRAVARRTASIQGHIVEQQVFEIGRTGQSTACDDGQPIAKVGETWALYLSRRPDGSYVASASYPLDMARKIDPRLRQP